MNEPSKRGGRRPGAGRPGGPSEVVRLPLPLAAIAKRMKDGSLRAGDINAFLDISAHTVAAVPLASTSAACGFPSPADDYMDRPLDFNELLMKNPAATFAVRISGESMRDRGMLPGDIAVVDRSRSAVGGDEFVVILTSQPQPEEASIVATRIIETLRRPFQVEGHSVEIGASIGVSLYPEDGADADALMRAADAAMYRAKEEGRGAVRFYEAAMNARLQARLRLEQELAGAAERGELVLHYQPIVNGVTGEVETFEALVRWVHPTRGMVPPMDFIPVAEECGLIDEIGRWVIDMACREAAGWTHSWRVSLNVSPRQFRHTDVCAALGDALRTHGITPARVVVEVTEGILIENAEKAVATLNRLREMGVRIALDDFGTGYSSLSYLQLFQFDKSFVRTLGESDRALTLTRTIVNLGHNLGLQVTAEGVETQAQLDILRSLGCDQIQGYLVARPAPIDAFTDLDQLRTKALFGRDRPRLSA